ncbi:MAG: DUF4224 domain-containing protein [Pseudomonadales bacterium]|nr:DUF4224 domain-containing protein [Pseudomonadales bacterium]
MESKSIFLSQADLQAFTGTKHAKLQSEYLAMRGIRFDVDRKGKVIVLLDSVYDYFDLKSRTPSGGAPAKRSKRQNSKVLNFKKPKE